MVLLIPSLYYGSFTLQIGRIVFNETTNLGQPSLSYSGAGGRAEPHSVYDYAFIIEPGGILRTVDTSTSTLQATTVVTIKVTITNFAGRVVGALTTKINGGIGQRSHTLYLGPNEGVRQGEVYSAQITITATISPSNSSSFTVSKTIPGIAFVVPAY